MHAQGKCRERKRSDTANAEKKTAMNAGANSAWSRKTRPTTGPTAVPGILRPRNPYHTCRTGATRTAPSSVMFPSRTWSNASPAAPVPQSAVGASPSGRAAPPRCSDRPSNKVWHAISPLPTIAADVRAFVATLTAPAALTPDQSGDSHMWTRLSQRLAHSSLAYAALAMPEASPPLFLPGHTF